MAKWRLSKHQAGLALSILPIFVLGYCVVRPEARDYPPYLSSSPDADGVKAWTDWLKENGRPVKEWRQPWKSLPDGTGQALIAIVPAGSFKDEQDELRRWVGQGNDALLFHPSPDGFAGWETDRPEADKADTGGVKGAFRYARSAIMRLRGTKRCKVAFRRASG